MYLNWTSEERKMSANCCMIRLALFVLLLVTFAGSITANKGSNQSKKCQQYGHSCLGGHGKRSGSLSMQSIPMSSLIQLYANSNNNNKNINSINNNNNHHHHQQQQIEHVASEKFVRPLLPLSVPLFIFRASQSNNQDDNSLMNTNGENVLSVDEFRTKIDENIRHQPSSSQLLQQQLSMASNIVPANTVTIAGNNVVGENYLNKKEMQRLMDLLGTLSGEQSGVRIAALDSQTNSNINHRYNEAEGETELFDDMSHHLNEQQAQLISSALEHKHRQQFLPPKQRTQFKLNTPLQRAPSGEQHSQPEFIYSSYRYKTPDSSM